MANDDDLTLFVNQRGGPQIVDMTEVCAFCGARAFDHPPDVLRPYLRSCPPERVALLRQTRRRERDRLSGVLKDLAGLMTTARQSEVVGTPVPDPPRLTIPEAVRQSNDRSAYGGLLRYIEGAEAIEAGRRKAPPVDADYSYGIRYVDKTGNEISPGEIEARFNPAEIQQRTMVAKVRLSQAQIETTVAAQAGRSAPMRAQPAVAIAVRRQYFDEE